ncbi:hypothetical protein LguiA_024327 [Lonicera macranthoides]
MNRISKMFSAELVKCRSHKLEVQGSNPSHDRIFLLGILLAELTQAWTSYQIEVRI